MAACTLLTIHYNLCAGTLAMFANRPYVKEILDRVLKFEYSYVTFFGTSTCIVTDRTFTRGQFCLTEVGHGLDVINMETTATLLPNGEFELNTPVKRAAK